MKFNVTVNRTRIEVTAKNAEAAQEKVQDILNKALNISEEAWGVV